jgi:competence ComEA-like helix-hairpin-helix protein
MLWLHHLQQRLAITRREALAILSILSLLFAGFTIQFIQKHNVPPVNRDLLLTDSLPSPDSLAVLIAASSSPSTGDVESTPLDSESSPDTASGSRIDLNTASAAELQTLSGIGPSLAGRVIAHREATPFTSVDELTDVRGIGPKTLAAIRSQVTVHQP